MYIQPAKTLLRGNREKSSLRWLRKGHLRQNTLAVNLTMPRRWRRFMLWFVHAMALAIVLVVCLPAAAQGRLSEDEALNIGVEAYVFGYPLLLMDVTRRVSTAVPKVLGQQAPINQFTHRRELPDHTFTGVVRPNADMLYSVAWLDLTREPMIL